MVLVRVSLPLSAGLKILHNILHRVTGNFPIISITDSSEWEGGAFSASPTALSHQSNRYGMVHRKHDNNNNFVRRLTLLAVICPLSANVHGRTSTIYMYVHYHLYPWTKPL